MRIKDIVEKKNNNEDLNYKEIEFVVMNYVNKIISDKEMSGFLFAVFNKGLSYKETYYLTDVMIKSGKTIDLSRITKPVVDKHSTGGIGDKTTLLVGPIVASLGIAVAKMSGKSLGFTGGTIDKLESINGYDVSLSTDEFFSNVNKIGISVISQSESVAIADKKIYALRDEIGAVDSIPLIASSIMSKKIASGANNIVIDLKVGKGAFMKNLKDADTLSKTMIKLGKEYNKKVVCVLTSMDYPLGYSIGNAVEVKEVIDFFDGRCEKRLKDLIINISSNMVSLGKKISYYSAKKLVNKSLKEGLAKSKFYEWIKIQKGNIKDLKDKSKKLIIQSDKTGYINKIDALKIGELVFSLGAGRTHKEDKIDYAVGIKLNVSVGDFVKKGDILGTIFYNKIIKNVNNNFIDCFVIEKKKKSIQNIIIKKIK